MNEGYEFIETPDGGSMLLEDKVSSRTISYTALLIEANKIIDNDLRAEALEMLRRVRLSISCSSEVNLGVVKGGKGN